MQQGKNTLLNILGAFSLFSFHIQELKDGRNESHDRIHVHQGRFAEDSQHTQQSEDRNEDLVQIEEPTAQTERRVIRRRARAEKQNLADLPHLPIRQQVVKQIRFPLADRRSHLLQFPHKPNQTSENEGEDQIMNARDDSIQQRRLFSVTSSR